MQTIGIKDLQTNPAILTKALEAHEYIMITKRSMPLGVAVSFDDTILSHGLKTSLLLDAYKNGNISLGQLSISLNLSKAKVMKMLSLMGIDVIEYDFNEDLEDLDSFL
ncbi:MAG: type II toxin-antitoxin system Phd/YefM family antitoxin [Campylobacterales bacterium]|nr:type II toxin-antitoxin system Phd/YefM family antitoxin [Campylobacterales bacterium]